MMQQIGIIGLGLMGGSMGLALKKYLPGIELLGSDSNEEHLNYALKKGIIDRRLTLEDIKELDIIFIAVPVRSVLDVIAMIFPRLEVERTIITDMGSTKTYLYRQITEHYPDLKYIGGHPMTGREISGPRGAVADLFKDKNYILIDGEKKDITELKNLLQRIGSRVLYLKPELHDQLVAVTSHLPQVLATTLVNELIKSERSYPLIDRLIGQGFLDLTRIAGSDPTMWTDIFITNKKELIKAINNFINNLEKLVEIIDKEDAEEIAGFMTAGRLKRNRLERMKEDGADY
jgi:prephenate dehydrogenase